MTSVRIGGLQIGIILLTLATALIHLWLGVVQLAIGMIGGIMFVANAAGYLGLLGALYLRWPMPFVSQHRSGIRWALGAFAAITILGWLAIGERNVVGYVDKVIEIMLILLLIVEARQ